METLLSDDSPRHVLWLARLRVAWRWCWKLDLAILGCTLMARGLTWWAIATHAMTSQGELNPVIATLFRLFGVPPAMIGAGLFLILLIIAVQTFFVSQSRLGKRIALALTWALLIAVALDAAWDTWDVAQYLMATR